MGTVLWLFLLAKEKPELSFYAGGFLSRRDVMTPDPSPAALFNACAKILIKLFKLNDPVQIHIFVGVGLQNIHIHNVPYIFI